MNAFEKATRQKLRFNYRGSQSVEELWDMPLLVLDTLFKELNADLKDQSGESLLSNNNLQTTTLELKIGIIKHIVSTKLQEQKDQLDLLANKNRKQKILGVIANKQDAELEGRSVEELNKLIDEMD